MENLVKLDAKKTALVLIDLQQGIATIPTEPFSSADVIKNANTLVRLFHEKGGFVVFVRVAMAADFKDALHPEVDETPWVCKHSTPG